MYECAHACMSVYVPVCTCAWWPEFRPRRHPSDPVSIFVLVLCFVLFLKAGTLTGLELQVKARLAGSQAPSICCLCLPSAQITSARSTPGFFYVGLGESTPDPHAFKASAVPFQRPQFEVIQNCRFLLTVYKSNRQERARVPRVQTLAHRKCVLSRMGLPRILHSSSLKCLCLAQNPLLHSLKGHIP